MWIPLTKRIAIGRVISVLHFHFLRHSAVVSVWHSVPWSQSPAETSTYTTCRASSQSCLCPEFWWGKSMLLYRRLCSCEKEHTTVKKYSGKNAQWFGEVLFSGCNAWLIYSCSRHGSLAFCWLAEVVFKWNSWKKYTALKVVFIVPLERWLHLNLFPFLFENSYMKVSTARSLSLYLQHHCVSSALVV